MPPDLHRMGLGLLAIVEREAVLLSPARKQQAEARVERVQHALALIEDEALVSGDAAVEELAFVATIHADRLVNHPEYHPDFAIEQSLFALNAWLAPAQQALDASPTQGIEATTHPRAAARVHPGASRPAAIAPSRTTIPITRCSIA